MNYLLLALFVCLGVSNIAQERTSANKSFIQLNTGMRHSEVRTSVFIGADLWVQKNLTFGLVLEGADDFSQMVYALCPRVDYHLGNILWASKKWDLYSGLRSDIWFVPESNNIDIEYKLNVGMRWYWWRRMGIHAEFGINPFNYNEVWYNSYNQLGFSYRF